MDVSARVWNGCCWCWAAAPLRVGRVRQSFSADPKVARATSSPAPQTLSPMMNCSPAIESQQMIHFSWVAGARATSANKQPGGRRSTNCHGNIATNSLASLTGRPTRRRLTGASSLLVVLALWLCATKALGQDGSGGSPPTPEGYLDEADSSDGSPAYYQPALIGFRANSASEILANGVSVVEANTDVTLTLYGESFTSNTIVAFTAQFDPSTEQIAGSSTSLADLTGAQALHAATPALTTTDPPPPTTTTATTTTTTTTTTTAAAATTTNSPPNEAQQLTRRQFANRRRVRSKSYDCTDYNRITSYRLTEANILSANVAVLTVNLPELDSSSAGQYYYFCLKQPRLTGANQSAPSGSNESSLVWVHQGDEWWVTLKVEPPILSIANDCVLIVFLLFLSAVTSGLNLGLMSLDMNELAVIASCGDHRERSYARTIAPLRKRGNYLLCSLLLGNVMVNSTLTVILEEMTSGLVAVIGSTLAIVVLGEIVPQAFCARQGLAIGARTIYLTYAFMILTFPLSYPISCLLDWVLGEEEGNVYDRERLMEFIRITGHHTQLEADEVAIISGALKLKKIKVDQIMTRIEDVFMLPIDCQLDRETIRRIIEKGYSRVPVYEFGDRKQIVALILAKDLALLDPDDRTPIADMLLYCKHPLIFIEDDATLDVALNEFKTGKSHMAVVRQIYDDGETDKYYEAIGVVTLEDVIEEVLQVEINDETDTLSDNRRKRRRTGAQVAHLIDELTGGSASTSASQAPAMLPPASRQAIQMPGAGGPVGMASKEVQAGAPGELTCVSVGGAGRSVFQSAATATSSSCESDRKADKFGQNPLAQVQFSPANESSRSFRRDESSLERSQPVEQQQQHQEHSDESEPVGVLSWAAQFLSNRMR